MRRSLLPCVLALAACSQVQQSSPETPQALAELVATGVAPAALPAGSDVRVAWEADGAAAAVITLPDLATAEAFTQTLPAGNDSAPAPPLELLRPISDNIDALRDGIASGAIRPARRIGPDGAWVFACDAERMCWAWRD
jgi:hypothetical protein